MSLLGLNQAANCMLNSRKSLEITGLNITNSQVEGYTRQEAVQTPVITGYSVEAPGSNVVSVGAKISEITRFRSGFIDTNYRNESINAGELSAESTYLGEMSQIFTDDSELGLSNILNEFWQGWNDASRNPDDTIVRNMVIEEGNNLARAIRLKSQKMTETTARLDGEIESVVEEINTIAEKLASINDRIIQSAPTTTQINAMMDQRDLMLDQLSELVGVQILGSVKESLTIYLDGMPLIANKKVYKLDVQKDAFHNFHIYSSSGKELNITGGKLSGLLDIKTDYIPEYKNELDEMTVAIIEQVNIAHKFGYGLDGSTGLDFFNGTSASNIGMNITAAEQVALSVPKLVSTSNINVDGEQVMSSETLAAASAKFLTAPEAAGTINVNGVDIDWLDTDTIQDILAKIEEDTGIRSTFNIDSQEFLFSTPPDSSTITINDTAGNFTVFTNILGAVTTGGEPGDGENGIRIFEISAKPIFGAPDPNQTINDKYRNLVSKVGFETNTVKSKNEIQSDHVKSIYEMRQSESGVSIDEETINLMKYQRTFQAGARLASVIDEMLVSLISIGK
ncbi:MAG: flagellar hook-associated protein FlgK [Candidatus Eremiobacteraeota bacterium]|nr:flagellar hook-associated protein FlgK [Candidatus Eremiobacteraeota bacterium]